MNQEHSIVLSDRRKLGYQCLGNPDGRALFFFHGTPGSRLVFSNEDLIAQIPNIWLIIPERPGYGISDPKPGRTLLDWAKDVNELADHLGLDRFTIAGESGGGPHALAVGKGIQKRVEKIYLFGSPSPAGFRGATKGMSIGNRVGLFLNRYLPKLSAAIIDNFAAGFAKDPDRFVHAMVKQMPPSDRAFMEDIQFREAIIRDYQEAYRGGSQGHVVDSQLALTSGDWGFSLRDIHVPVYLWHGEEDTLVSRNMAEFLINELPNCTSYFIPKAGHFLLDRREVIEKIEELINVAV